jgi:cyclophilin family peptidyl-prolyl cis-trans isomerase
MALFFFASNRGRRVVNALLAGAAARGRGLTVALVLCLLACVAPRAADAGTLVNFNTQLGTIQVDLFDDLVPETVDNFLSYAGNSSYSNTVIHRSTSIADSGLAVIQGGGFTYDSGSGLFVQIPSSDPIALQYNRDNTAGTIAMARTGDPNSATSQWFINTVDNSAVLGPSNGGGFAVFGWIVGNGLSVAQQINNLNKSGFGQFSVNVPLKNYTPPQLKDESNLVLVNSVTVVGEHPSFQNPFNHADVVNDGILRVSDAHAIINDLLANGLRAIEGPFSGTNYLDANGSGTITVADAHNVINALLSQASTAPLAALDSAPLDALGSATLAAPRFAVVPEPTSLSLAAAAAALALAAGTLRRRRRLAAARAAR